VAANLRAFEWGRAAAHDPEAVRRLATREQGAQVIELKRPTDSLAEIVARRVQYLTAYQNAAYAQRYEALVSRVRRVESERIAGATQLAEAVARNYFKLLAYKDEYEVARLHADPAFRARLAAQFEGIDGRPLRLYFHLAPPLLAPRDPATGLPRKLRFGPWILPLFALMVKRRFLRGTPLDPFGYTAERKAERALIVEYEQLIEELLEKLAPDTHALAVQLASLPEEIRGFGHVKARAIDAVRTKREALLARLRGGKAAQVIKLPARAA
ncbi:MAG: indolepyruvate ferredoxin oxidoreductase family protein, partial [Burkholderiaceae bacterium]|nr:indolepyruvate ferredoxin oxidoreductase family protein [Burkholderiaceae bacterium]